MSGAKQTNRKSEGDARHQLGGQVAMLPGVAVASGRGLRLVGLAADDDPELGLLGVVALREVAGVCEEHQVARARNAGWTWAQIAAALEVSPKLFINATPPDSPPPSPRRGEWTYNPILA